MSASLSCVKARLCRHVCGSFLRGVRNSLYCWTVRLVVDALEERAQSRDVDVM